MVAAIQLLIQSHDSYKVLLDEEPSITPPDAEEDGGLLEMTCSRDLVDMKKLAQAADLKELEAVFKSLRGQNDAADAEDVMIVDMRDEVHQYNPSFIIDWRAKTPMVSY